MTDAGAASARATKQFRPLAIDGAVYFLRASLDHGVIALELTDGAESWYGSTRDLNFKDAGVDRDEFARTVLAGLQRGGDGATFTLKHLHDGGRQRDDCSHKISVTIAPANAPRRAAGRRSALVVSTCGRRRRAP